MTAVVSPPSILSASDVDAERARSILGDALAGADDGELFLERSESESFVFDDGRLKSAAYDSTEGFGLRVVAGETAGYAHAAEISEAAIRRAADAARLATRGYAGIAAEAPRPTNAKLYGEDDPVAHPAFSSKVALLQEIDAYARKRDPRVAQVSASLAGERRVIEILRADGRLLRDVRPLVRLNVAITVERDGRRESGTMGAGGRAGFEAWISPDKWQEQVEEALRQALVNLDSVACPAGEMDVVLGPGWNGVLLHEAVGHGLEGDFNRKGSSAFSGRIGERVAAPGVTVFDDGSILGRRGSLTIDDEGTPTERTILIKDGILKGYMHDRMSARLMGMEATGNGRRQSYAHMPMPRMTNTGMLAGSHTFDEMIASTKRGLYCANFAGGQVDITNGKFVFQCTEAYMIEDGKITKPVKGATLIGDGPSALTRVTMIGDDFCFDPGIGVCGKAGQGVPVGVGQPSLKITGLTVGGAELKVSVDDAPFERIDGGGASFAVDQSDRARLLREGEPMHRELRTDLPDDYAGYLEQVLADGARLTQLVEGGAVRAIALWRVYLTTYAGRRLEIDDLVTAQADRSRGYGATLVAHLEEKARAYRCTTLALNSATFRADAHRFYFRQRFSIGAFHFMKRL